MEGGAGPGSGAAERGWAQGGLCEARGADVRATAGSTGRRPREPGTQGAACPSTRLLLQRSREVTPPAPLPRSGPGRWWLRWALAPGRGLLSPVLSGRAFRNEPALGA